MDYDRKVPVYTRMILDWIIKLPDYTREIQTKLERNQKKIDLYQIGYNNIDKIIPFTVYTRIIPCTNIITD